MDKRLIIIPVVLFASVLLLNGLINEDVPVPDMAELDEVPAVDSPARVQDNSDSTEDSDDLQEEAEEEELPSLGMGGSAPKMSGASLSAPAEVKPAEDPVVEDPVVEDPVVEDNEENGPACPNESIPEFPTIALPMLAILGLAFIFRRK